MLEKTLEHLAHCTWADMDSATYTLGFTPDERYFTDRSLLVFAKRHPTEVFASRANVNENHTGADFEWWIRDGQSVIGLLVQAKRLVMADHGQYHGLDRATDDGTPQPERLIQTAASRGMTPIYVMYNGGRPQFPEGPCRGRLPLRCRGTTVTSAGAIHALACAGSTASLADVQKYAIPWQCLVACRLPGLPEESLPARMAATLTAYDIHDAAGDAVTNLSEADERIQGLFMRLDDLPRDPRERTAPLAAMNELAAMDAAARVVIVHDATRDGHNVPVFAE
jgi:hypothetical protein